MDKFHRAFRAFRWAATTRPQPKRCFETVLMKELTSYQSGKDNFFILLLGGLGFAFFLMMSIILNSLFWVIIGLFPIAISARAVDKLNDDAVRRRVSDLESKPITIEEKVILSAEWMVKVKKEICAACGKQKSGEFLVIWIPWLPNQKYIAYCSKCAGERR